MARKPMVTRTIVTTKVTVLTLDTTTCEPGNVTVVIPRTYKDDEKMLKAVRPLVEIGDVKAVSIVSAEEVEELYGMSEQEFISNAKKLDKETRKMLEESNEIEEQ